MTEVSFAKQFLTALESRPSRLSSDHVVDPKTYPAQSAFILPRMPQPKRKPASRAAAPPGATPADDDAAPTTAADPPTPQQQQQQATALVTLKPTRATHPTHTLSTPVPVATTSMHDLKAAYSAAAPGVSVAKIKILYAKKPVGDTKTIRDVLPASSTTTDSADPIPVEFSVMVLGGGGGGGTPTAAGTPAISTPERVASPAAATTVEVEMGEAPVVAGPADAAGVLGSEEFWVDLKAFLVGRLRDEAEGERLAGVFRGAWAKGSA